MSEVAWDWPKIASMLLWKLAPRGTVLTRKDLGALPQDRVLITERLSSRLVISFVPLAQAMRIRQALSTTPTPAGLSTLEGRWEKIAVVMLWKLKKSGVTLTQWDHDCVPNDRQILAHGHRDGVEFRFMPNKDAAVLSRERGDPHLIVEAIQ